MANVEKLIAGVSKTHPPDMNNKTLIRANQGHSIPVDVELEKVEPPKLVVYLFLIVFLIIFAILRKSFAFRIAIPWDSSPNTTN